MSRDFRTGRHVVYELYAHIVLTPKYRRKVFTERVSQVTEDVARQCCERNEAELLEFNTDSDHAHLLISYPLRDHRQLITVNNTKGEQYEKERN